jgi:HEPN domain-containing protein
MRKDDLEEGKRWLRQAEEDLEAASALMQAGKYYMVCFVSQQAAEKALKGYLYAQGEEFLFSHSVWKLCHLSGKYDKRFQELSSRVKDLDLYYIEARYPNSLNSGIPAEFFEEKDAAQAGRLAKEVIDFVKERLESGK